MANTPKTDLLNITYDLAVIGGGPAGMMAAGRAAERGLKVVLIEKNNSLLCIGLDTDLRRIIHWVKNSLLLVVADVMSPMQNLIIEPCWQNSKKMTNSFSRLFHSGVSKKVLSFSIHEACRQK